MKYSRLPECCKTSRQRLYLFIGLVGISSLIWTFTDVNFYIAHVATIVSKTVTQKSSTNSTVKVVCMIMTSAGNWKTAARAIRHTWAKRCHIPLVFYSKFPNYTSHEIYKADGTVPLDVPEGKEHLTDKTYAALNYSYEKYKTVADFYVKLDDDVFLVWENFMVLVREFDPNNLIYFGRKDDPKLSKAGGTGYFLSKAAVPLMFGNGSACLRDFARNFTSDWEDMMMGKCLSDSESAREMPAGFLERWLYPSHNSRAKLKGPTPPESPYKFANRTGVDFGNVWLKDGGKYNFETITFHHLDHAHILMFEFMLYQLERPNIK